MPDGDSFGAIREFEHDGTTYKMADLTVLEEQGLCDLDKLPVSIRILLESVLRNVDGDIVTEEDVRNAASWEPDVPNVEVPFTPSRVVLQDLTGVPAVVDLAALRSAADRAGEAPSIVEPEVPCDLVIDHSVQVDFFGSSDAYEKNVELEYERNAERYKALKWAQNAFDNFSVVPPGTGIVHQVNLEHLGQVVHDREWRDEQWLLPDTLVGTDSHTPMIGGIGVVGWGVGGIEAEAAMLGQPITMKLPEVVGVRLEGELPEGATATDLVLHVTEQLREVGVVDRFVEFFGPGVGNLSVPDRATISNMAPEQGSTISVFPVDEATLDYLELTGRDPEHIELVREYLDAQGLFGEQHPEYTETVDIDLSVVEPSLAGPKRPQDRVPMGDMKTHFRGLVHREFEDDLGDVDEVELERWLGDGGRTDGGAAATEVAADLDPLTKQVTVEMDDGTEAEIGHGSVVVSAITSCTNTSNPSVMVAAGILARNALEKGLDVPNYVKTSLAPGSQVVTEYLKEAELLPYLEELGYDVVGYGCTTCIGNAGPLPEPIENAIDEHDLWTTSVLSGNRNFEARIHPKIRANYLASPPLVVAYGLAGRMDIDLETDPLGTDEDGEPVYLADIWPDTTEVQETIHNSIDPSMFREKYAEVFEGDERWEALEAPTGDVYEWDDESTYIREPPFFKDFPLEEPGVSNVEDARCLLTLGDTVTTDHISPAGPFGPDLPAGQWLMDHGVDPVDFNTYGSRRGNHEVMMRGTFANVRIENQMLDDVEGGYTIHHPTDEETTVFEASERYREEGTPLVVLSGVEFGTGSSRDWAAKGTDLLGVRATIAESYERIYRDNLVGMGVLPLQFAEGDSWESLGLDGSEHFDILGLDDGLEVNDELTVVAEKDDGSTVEFPVTAQVGTPAAVKYVENGGILHYVLRRLLTQD
ncbi:aconitate hydratase AcnA [Haloferax mediterranei ATCC 33500]|uniref:Aconitate hydratase n=1 Tax=Haloferax mediterranei (strain ATCC 33500 / DSM 1411 / JCM 8866 / NBRC 14739 / NCIMB 2177 / R-4) TaxID=523841 RepID=I3R1X8_HALMT|nr:aconitate hydratase AcnA [Haloferax mediterranei]AFK18238.1 aconitate hydratase [Haloferax mediterranei ATCC 33500]AHZ22361.1 aconitate hydratase [Haloferax mediterranei ATCC 33500]EMA02491.1 aconitate hydratase [Haloferax mediterranei ATCC 33500]MDX5988326.1 aconitate hydratase AcnA [Haloferax mediterranei ATCC 33500]QCQ74760.1 aconitate hydratase AcnA [Haloferax mediterranei ATCC 33500]